MAVIFQPVQDGFLPGKKLALAVPNGKVQSLEAAREDAGGGGVHLQVDPPVLEPPRIVEGQGRFLAGVVSIEPGKKPELDHELKAVANTENELPRPDKPEQLIEQPFPALPDPAVEETIGSRLG